MHIFTNRLVDGIRSTRHQWIGRAALFGIIAGLLYFRKTEDHARLQAVVTEAILEGIDANFNEPTALECPWHARISVDCITPLPDGSLDPNFGNSGSVTTGVPGGATAMALQSDGKIVVGGFARNGTTTGLALTRLVP